jgi:hypothetical protein
MVVGELIRLRHSPNQAERLGYYCVYRRHTNFAMESIEQTFSGAVDFGLLSEPIRVQ